jgi:signal transduction histidine kinase
VDVALPDRELGEYRIVERRVADPQRDRVRLSVLAEIGLLFASGDDSRAILQRVCDVAVPSLGDRCAVFLGTGKRRQLDATASKIADPNRLDFRSRLVVPLVIRDRVLGVLALAKADAPCYDRDDLAFAEELARRVAMYLDHAMLLREQSQLIAELERINHDLDQFAYVASHDLRAPLRGISNLVAILEQDLGDRLDDGTSTSLDLLRNRAHRLEEMIEAVLSYSRAGRIVDPPVRIEVPALVREVIELLDVYGTTSPGTPGPRVEIEPGLPTLHTARVPLEQVLLNLIGNAIKHARRPDPRVVVGGRLVEEDAAWEVFVRDNGPGIAPRHHDLVWKMFSTLQPRDEVEGAGMGLAIVRRIVESVGGRTWLESDAGAGATFYFTWPLRIARERWRPA